jgi:hypothetical protein
MEITEQQRASGDERWKRRQIYKRWGDTVRRQIAWKMLLTLCTARLTDGCERVCRGFRLPVYSNCEAKSTDR